MVPRCWGTIRTGVSAIWVVADIGITMLPSTTQTVFPLGVAANCVPVPNMPDVTAIGRPGRLVVDEIGVTVPAF
jgi:hypothetical protein